MTATSPPVYLLKGEFVWPGECLPFEAKAPNATTREVLAELMAGKGAKFATVDSLIADLHADA